MPETETKNELAVQDEAKQLAKTIITDFIDASGRAQAVKWEYLKQLSPRVKAAMVELDEFKVVLNYFAFEMLLGQAGVTKYQMRALEILLHAAAPKNESKASKVTLTKGDQTMTVSVGDESD